MTTRRLAVSAAAGEATANSGHAVAITSALLNEILAARNALAAP
jgi:hypothetical protein